MWSFIIFILELVILFFIFLQDYKTRSVSLWVFISLAILGTANLFFADDIFIKLKLIGLFEAFLLVKLIILTIYFSIKHNRIINISKDYLGLGDVLFWLLIPIIFPYFEVFVFYLVSLVIALLIHLLRMSIFKKQESVPLAGYQAFCLIVFLVIQRLI